MQISKNPWATTRPNAKTLISQQVPSGPGSPAGPYGIQARRYAAVGIPPIPCGGKDGKRPLIKFAGSHAPTVQSVTAALDRPSLQMANVGILTGAGSCPITVVDIDDPALVTRVLQALGDTTIKVRTPSGGTHLYYRNQGERSTNLRPQLPIDIKGAGGFVVAPPSVREPFEDHPGGEYRFEEGGLAELLKLPPPLPTDWRQRLERLAGPGQAAAKAAPGAIRGNATRKIPIGVRNNTLFRAGLQFAASAENVQELAAILEDINLLHFEKPLPAAEVTRAAMSAFGYQERGSNWAQGNGVFQISAEELNLIESSDALRLLAHLRIAHGSRPEPFAVAVRSMVKHGSIPSMGETALRSAREYLVQRGFLRRVHAGGKAPGDPAKFVLVRPPLA